MTDTERIKMITKAVKMQAGDYGLWNPITIGEAYITQALRDLHKVIESSDKDALERIRDCAECAHGDY